MLFAPWHTRLEFNSGQGRSIAVPGLGYVGCVTAAGLAKLGHRVYGIDKDEAKIDSILAAKAPFYELGPEEAIRETVAAGRLSASTELEPGLANSDIALICVGTPSARNGDLSVDQLERVLGEIRPAGPPAKPTFRGLRLRSVARVFARPLWYRGEGRPYPVSGPAWLRCAEPYRNNKARGSSRCA